MYEIECSMQDQVCCRIATSAKQRFCLRYGYMCLR